MEETESKFCPECGYDLRATTADRCPECGLQVDLASMAQSRIPWEHRREIGRVKAFLKTVLAIAFDWKMIRHEMGRPQSLSDAKKFAWVVLGLLWVGMVVVVWMEVGRGMLGDGWMARPPEPRWGQQGVSTIESIFLDVGAISAVPLSSPIFVLMMTLLVMSGWMFLHAAWFGRRQTDCEKCRALAIYAMAPLTFWLVPICVLITSPLFDIRIAKVMDYFPIQILILLEILMVLAVLCAWLRAGQWHARMRRAGIGSCLIGVSKLLACWIAAFGAWMLICPLCIGLLVFIFRGW